MVSVGQQKGQKLHLLNRPIAPFSSLYVLNFVFKETRPVDAFVAENAMLEEKSRDILNILSHDSRTSAETIARMIGLTTAEVQQKIDEFEKTGIIKQYHATINWEKAGVDKIVAFVDVKVQPAREVGFDAVAFRVAKHAQVQSAWLVSGGSDLRLLVETTTMSELANFVAEKLATIEGVTSTNTHFLLRTYKADYALFSEPDVDNRLVITP